MLKGTWWEKFNCSIGRHKYNLIGSYMGCGGALRAIEQCDLCKAERTTRFIRNPWDLPTEEEINAQIPIKKSTLTIGNSRGEKKTVYFDGKKQEVPITDNEEEHIVIIDEKALWDLAAKTNAYRE